MTDLADLGHRTLMTYSRALTAWSSRGGWRERHGVLACNSGSWIPIIANAAFRTDDAVAPAALLDQAEEYFGALGRGYSIKVRDSGMDDDLRAACEARGLAAFGEPAPEMVCRAPLAVPALAGDVVLRRVEDEAGVADFCRINGEAYSTYGMPAEVMADLFDRPAVVLADPDTAMVVADVDGHPMATALVYVSDGVASLQWVGTRREARHLRLGAAVTGWTTNEAFARGATACTLQASPMGEPLYARLGYEYLYRYTEHVRWRRDPTSR